MKGSNYIGSSGFGVESTGNTTTTLLSGGATFTGTGEQNPFAGVFCSCFSDTAGTLFFDFSVNGTDWRTYPVAGFSVSAGIHEVHEAVKGPRYFRARFVNGSTAQATFQLYTYYGEFSKLSAPLNQAFGLDADAQIVQSLPDWMPISRGKATGIDPIKKFGRNDSVGATFAPIAIGGVYQTPQSGSATTLRVKAGGNANDTAAGSGARSITLEGLDENFEFVTEVLATAGASASSATTATFTRLYRVYVTPGTGSGTYASATSGSHSGDIVIENGSGGTDWGTIDSTDFPKGQSEIGAYTVEAGKTGYVILRHVTADTGKALDLIFFSRENADETAAPYTAMRAQSVIIGIDGGAINQFGSKVVPFGPYIGPTDIGFMGKVSAGTGSVSIEFEIVIIDEV